MLKFTMKVDMDNAAFQDNTAAELARILRLTAAHVEKYNTGGKVLDLNGNTCGTWKIR